MKKSIFFLLKSIVVGLVLTQTTLSDTGYQIMGGQPIDEAILLTICGVGLLALGLYKSKSNA